MTALEGQIAVVTGGSQGIGRGVCLRLAQDGARVAILDISDAAETRGLIAQRGGESWYRETDISDPRSIEESFAALESEWGAPRALANVAGVFDDVPFLDTTEAIWDRHLDVNAKGMFFCCQSAARRMREAGGGRIVNILSTAAGQGFALESAYCASKGAALLLTRTLAIELAADGIVVNGVGPGTIQTEMGADYLAGGPIAQHELSRTPLGRFGEPEDIAEAVTWLLRDARWLTGQVIYVDGGFMAAGLPYLDGLERPRVRS
ncbi:MAG TPA: SDR family oxidoreductase [Solirubrobacteraceae bacterium]|nr:SDR family oxidoreductase [Solirubrobacteraceae bacterium]